MEVSARLTHRFLVGGVPREGVEVLCPFPHSLPFTETVSLSSSKLTEHREWGVTGTPSYRKLEALGPARNYPLGTVCSQLAAAWGVAIPQIWSQIFLINTIEGAEESLSMKEEEPKMTKRAAEHRVRLRRLDAFLLPKLPFTLSACCSHTGQ